MDSWLRDAIQEFGDPIRSRTKKAKEVVDNEVSYFISKIARAPLLHRGVSKISHYTT